MLIHDLVTALESIAPPSFAESWDKVGLLVGDRGRPISGPIVLTIDLTEAVLEEASKLKASAIVAYHPPIFEPLNRVTSATPRQRVVLRAIERQIAVYSPHTALDAISGGVTDWLCEGLAGGAGGAAPGKVAGDCRALVFHADAPMTQQVKIVTFVPPNKLEDVRMALASSGAGIIGAYTLCSFASSGEGTFLGGGDTKPAVGRPGVFERVLETRLEMVCSRSAVPLAIETLRRFHPYEQPAIDVYELLPIPQRSAGAGRRLVLDQPASILDLARRLKSFLKCDRVMYAAPGDPNKPIARVGVVPGAGASLSRTAAASECELFVTGEMKHHEILGALNAGMGVILAGHTNTERGYLPRLQHLLGMTINCEIRIAQSDRDVLSSV